MALQGPFFGKRDEPTTPRGPGSTPLSGTSALGSAGAAGAQPFAAPSAAASPAAPASTPVAASVTESGAKLIVCATTSGDTARNIAKFRPETPIAAITPSLKTLNQLQLSWGVSAYLMPFASSFDELLANIKVLKQM